MNYTQLSTSIQDHCQNSETSFLTHLNDFIIAAEDRIFFALTGPFFWKSSVARSTVDGTTDVSVADGTIDILGVRICTTVGGDIATGGPFKYLLRKDLDFIFEAFPGTSAGGIEKGVPRFYAVLEAHVNSNDPRMNIRMGPTPDAVYKLDVEYYGKAETDSITSGSTPALPLTTETWLSVTFPDVLLWGSVLQGYTYMKGDSEIMATYEKRFNEGLMLLKNMGESRNETDTYSDQG